MATKPKRYQVNLEPTADDLKIIKAVQAKLGILKHTEILRMGLRLLAEKYLKVA